MTMRRFRSLARRPQTECLESRQLLSQTVSGTDADGDTWVLKLIGAGSIRVTKQPDSSGNFTQLTDPSEIDSIEIAGADPQTSRLVGQVKKGPDGDGKVFFSSMTEIGGRSEGILGTNGIHTIDMPNFWLGQTSTDSTAAEPSISIPDGVNTLRFGGADTDFTPPGGTPLNTNGTADAFTVDLGLTHTEGTSIIIDKSITDAQATSGTGTAPTQDSVTFTVDGRLNQFIANEIDGNTTFPSSGFQGGGGTIVNSTEDPLTTIIGQIGFVRVGGNATNFSAMTDSLMSNFYIGGETNNVQVLAVAGSRSIQFGKGMDTVTIFTHFIDTLLANRGALNSNVTVDRAVGRVTIGGDVVNTNILAGYGQNLATLYSSQTAPTTMPDAQDGGSLNNIVIAGDVTDSVFAASTQPDFGTFGTDDMTLPIGHINAKIEGPINNSNATPDSPNQAFYAKNVTLAHGPVAPPNVPELPLPGAGKRPIFPRVSYDLQPTGYSKTNFFPKTHHKVKTPSVSTPKGPGALKASKEKKK